MNNSLLETNLNALIRLQQQKKTRVSPPDTRDVTLSSYASLSGTPFTIDLNHWDNC